MTSSARVQETADLTGEPVHTHPPLRILQLCPTMYEAGTWFRCLHLTRGLARRGHDVTLVKISPDRRVLPAISTRDGYTLVETPRFFGSSFSHGNTRLVSDLLARFALVGAGAYDVVHTYSHHLNAVLPGLLGKALRRRTALVLDWDDLWTEGGLYGSAPRAGLLRRADYAVDVLSERYFKRLGDGVTVVSRDLVRRSLLHGVAGDRVCFLPNGAPVDTIVPADRASAREQLRLPSDRPLLIFVGFGQYDLDLIFDAMAHLRDGGLEVFLVVTGPNGPAVQKEVVRRGLDGQVRVAGLVPFEEMQRYLAAADVGLLPYADKPINHARWPIKLGDYIAAGLPVATCAVGEMGAFVDAWKVGVSTKPDAADYARGIRWLLREQDLGELSRRARTAAEHNSWDVVAANAEAFYRRCMQRARAGT